MKAPIKDAIAKHLKIIWNLPIKYANIYTSIFIIGRIKIVFSVFSIKLITLSHVFNKNLHIKPLNFLLIFNAVSKTLYTNIIHNPLLNLKIY